MVTILSIMISYIVIVKLSLLADLVTLQHTKAKLMPDTASEN